MPISLRRFFTHCATIAALACLSFVGIAPQANASLDVPQLLSFQGRLTDASRITVDDGSYNMKFALYTAASGGTCLWAAAGTCGTPTAVSVTVTDGVFSVLLGDTGQNAFDDDLFDTYTTLYLGITIGSDSEMTPRKHVAASAFAMQAGDSDLLDSLNTDNDGCTSACVPVTTSAGNLTVTGDPQSSSASGASLFVNPASAGANEALVGVSSNGTERFLVDEDGDTTMSGNSITLGNSSASSDTNVNIYNSNNSYASLTGSRYSSYDSLQVNSGVLDSTYGSIFAYNGFQISASPNTATPLYINETSYDNGDAGGNRDDAGLFIDTSSTSHTTSGSYRAIGARIRHSYTGSTTTGASLIGIQNDITSNPGGTLASAYGVNSALTHSGSNNLTVGYGTYSALTNASSGTVGTAYAVYGYANTSSGTTTNSYGGLFRSTGGTTDYAIYAGEGLVQIEGDTTPTTPTTATGDGELFVLNDIESDANLDIAGFAGVGTAPTSTETLNVYKAYASVGAGNTRKGSYTQTTTTTANGASSSLVGSDVYTAVTDTGGISDMVENLLGVRASVVHAADGTVTRAYGVTSSVDLSNASGTITTATGVHSEVTNSGTGTITATMGVNTTASGGSKNWSLFAGKGFVQIEGADYAGSPTAPTLTTGINKVGDTGSLFVNHSVEIYDGALCVGDGALNNCSNAAGADGIIYSTAASVTAHDLAEMFPSHEYLLAGDIVSADSRDTEYVQRASGTSVILGAVSTKPGLTLGWGGENEYPIALTGRTPIKVNGEGGAIAIGDRIGLSSVAGVGKKATGAGEVVGVAMQAFSGSGEGAVMTFVSPEHWNGSSSVSIASSQPEPTLANAATISDNGILAIQENRIGNIASLRGYNWSVNESGVFITEGSYDVRITSHQGEKVDTHAVLSIGHFINLVGTTTMQGDVAVVNFEQVEPKWNDIISATVPPMIIATVSQGGGVVSVTQKDQNGFTLHREVGNPTKVDWVAYGYRKGEEPVEEEIAQEELPTEEVVVISEPAVGAVQEENIESTAVTNDVVPEEVIAPVVIEDAVEPIAVEETVQIVQADGGETESTPPSTP